MMFSSRYYQNRLISVQHSKERILRLIINLLRRIRLYSNTDHGTSSNTSDLFLGSSDKSNILALKITSMRIN